jgi:hypothetical protein
MGSMWRRGHNWQLVLVFTVAGLFGIAVTGYSQWSSYTAGTRALLEGNWQSCRESDGHYSERVYDNTLPGIGPFELHLGPYHEFALFRGIQDNHRDHSSSENLLRPFNIEVRANRAIQKWDVGGLHLQVALGGGGREDCESWFVTLKRAVGGSSN